MEKYGFVYIWRDRKHNRYYIGSHWGTEDDGYICSSRMMRQAYRRRPEDFKRKILERIYDKNRQKLYDVELKWLSFIKEEEIKTRYYNLNIKGTGHWSAYPENIKTIKEKISYKTKEAMQRPEVRQKLLEGTKNKDNRSSDPEVREKRKKTMQKTMAEKFPVDKRKKRLKKDDPKLNDLYSQKSKEMWENRSEQQKQELGNKISDALKNSKEQRAAHMSSLKWWNNGTINKRSKEQPGSEWNLGRIECKTKEKNGRIIFVNSIKYNSIQSAIQHLNISRSTLTRRLQSNDHKEYYYSE
jgi:hypothetical protein